MKPENKFSRLARDRNTELLNPPPLIFAFLVRKHSGIQVRSSQNNNVVLFSVFRSASRHETNLFIFNHLHKISPRFPQAVDFSSGQGTVGQRFTIKNG